jgi:hypothetical protein
MSSRGTTRPALSRPEKEDAVSKATVKAEKAGKAAVKALEEAGLAFRRAGWDAPYGFIESMAGTLVGIRKAWINLPGVSEELHRRDRDREQDGYRTYTNEAVAEMLAAWPGSIRSLARAAGMPHTTLLRIQKGVLGASPQVAHALLATATEANQGLQESTDRLAAALKQGGDNE